MPYVSIQKVLVVLKGSFQDRYLSPIRMIGDKCLIVENRTAGTPPFMKMGVHLKGLAAMHGTDRNS